MKKLMITILITSLFSCDPNIPVEYMQFSIDDLSHLYYDKDTLTYFGQDFEYTDTVYFLHNGLDTIVVPVKTDIQFTDPSVSFLNQKYINGSSSIHFDKKIGFAWAGISMWRRDIKWNSRKFFEVGTGELNSNAFSEIINEQDTLLSLDTALINGKLYNDVYKFYEPVGNNPAQIKSVFFAKKYGFIMMESKVGNRLELIKIKSKGTLMNQ